ncbi:MAG: hypothetical protein LBV20_01975 [Treponema sp.]|jgi:hypothetical protein|nr:hypothetical protein [Treponema sp.]
MKSKYKVFGLIMLAMISLFIVGCPITDPLAEEPEVLRTRFIATPGAELAPRSTAADNGLGINNMIDFRDSTYYYYMFYLGRMDSVPLQIDFPALRWSGSNPRTESFEMTTATATTIEEASSYANSVTDEQYSEASVEVSVTASAGFPLVGVESTVTAGYTSGWSKSSTETWETSYSKAEEYSLANAHAISVDFDGDDAEGYYRYVLFGTLDVYALVIYDPAKPEAGYTVKTISDVLGTYYDLDYSTSVLFDDEAPEELPFDASLLDKLGYKPERDISEMVQLDAGNTQHMQTFSPANGARDIRIREDNGQEHCDTITTNFDLTKLRASGYTKIEIAVDYDVKGIDESDMELWIRKGHGRTGKQWLYRIWDHGGSGKDEWWGSYLSTCTVDINEWDNTMTLMWGAQGQNEDDWWLGTTYLTVRALK